MNPEFVYLGDWNLGTNLLDVDVAHVDGEYLTCKVKFLFLSLLKRDPRPEGTDVSKCISLLWPVMYIAT